MQQQMPARPTFQQRHTGKSNASSAPSIPVLPKTHAWIVLLSALSLALVQLGAIAVNVLYLFVVHSGYVGNGRVQSTAPLGTVNTVTGFPSKILGWSVAPVMILMAYSSASQWLRTNQSQRDDERPTPVQLGTLMTVLGGANLLSLGSGVAYLCRATGDMQRFRKFRIKTPGYVSRAITLLLWLLVLENTSSVVSLILHATSEAVPVHRIRALSEYSGDYSQALNMTLCNDPSVQICHLRGGGNNENYLFEPASLRVLANASLQAITAYLDDGTAVLAPPVLPDYSYRAHTVGVKATCNSIIAECVDCTPASQSSDGFDRCAGPEASPNFSCVGPHRFNATSQSGYGGGLLDGDGNAVYSLQGLTNPFAYANIVASFAYAIAGVVDNQYAGDSGFLIHGHQGGWNVLYCDVLVSDVIYTFTSPSTFTLVSSSPANNLTTSVVAAQATGTNSNAVLTQPIDGIGVRVGDTPQTYADAFAGQLSKMLLSQAVNAFEPVATDAFLGEEVLGSSLSLITFLILVLSNALFTVTTIFVGVLTTIECASSGDPLIAAVRRRLTTPLFLLGEAYGRTSEEPGALVSADPTTFFEPEEDRDRLEMSLRHNGKQWRLRAEHF